MLKEQRMSDAWQEATEIQGPTKTLYSRSIGWSPRLGAEVPTRGSDSNQTGALPAMTSVKQNPRDWSVPQSTLLPPAVRKAIWKRFVSNL